MKYKDLPLGPFSCISHPQWIWVKTPTGYFDTDDWEFVRLPNQLRLGGSSDYHPVTLKVNANLKTATRGKKKS